MNEISRNKSNYAFAAIILLGFFLRAYHLGDKVLYCDEQFILHGVRISNMAELKEYYRYEPHIMLPTIITKTWISTFGDSIAALHSESLLWSTLALIAFAFAVASGLPLPAALSATALFAFNPFLIEFAQLLRYPSLLVFFATLWFLGLMKLKDGGGAAWLALYAAGLALSACAHLYTIYFAASLGAVVLFTRQRWGRLYVPMVAVHFIPLFIIGPKLLQLRDSGVTSLAGAAHAGNPIAHLLTFPIGGIVDVFYSLCCGRFIIMHDLPKPALAVILAFFTLVCAAALLSSTRKFEAKIFAAVLALSMILGWLAMIFFSVPFFNHYYAPMTIMFSALAGMGAARIGKTAPLATPVLTLIICAFFISRLIPYWNTIDREPNPKSILEYVEKNARSGDVLSVSPPYLYYLEYYWNDAIPTSRFEPDYDLRNARHNLAFRIHAAEHALTTEDMERWRRDYASKYRRVWMYWILGPANSEDPDMVARKWMEERFVKLESHPVRLFTYDSSMPALLELYEIPPEQPAP